MVAEKHLCSTSTINWRKKNASRFQQDCKVSHAQRSIIMFWWSRKNYYICLIRFSFLCDLHWTVFHAFMCIVHILAYLKCQKNSCNLTEHGPWKSQWLYINVCHHYVMYLAFVFFCDGIKPALWSLSSLLICFSSWWCVCVNSNTCTTCLFAWAQV